MDDKEKQELKNPTTQAPKSKVKEKPENSSSKGMVIGCLALAVRQEANPHSTMVFVISYKDEVDVNLKDSTEDMYNIKTTEGVTGYCNKQFIKLI